ncbi:MAG: DUF808 domain-containing protein [Corynebacterium sp.]|nr:DUF808 domain-containing protein [Corynebacterium sp.]
MAIGLAALLDDVALIARSAAASVDDVAAASARTASKAAGVVIDDAAVTPQMVNGVSPERELPIIWRIAKGSIFNKLVIILPIIVILNALLPQILHPILMIGGAYLCFEGAEKIFGHGHEEAIIEAGPEAEKKMVSGAIRTDLILSAEIMVISLNEVANQPLPIAIATLIVVGLLITVVVYGAVALIIKLDDIGLKMLSKGHKSGQLLVSGMPKVLTVLSVVGTAAMLWVGGHLVTSDFFHLPEFTHNGVLQWSGETLVSMIFGLIIGSIVMLIVSGIGKLRGAKAH